MKPTLLITGASSFLGAHTLRYLEQRYPVIGLYHTHRPTFTQSPLYSIDLSKSTALRTLQNLQFDYIVHIAGKIQSSGPISAIEYNQQMLDTLLQLQKPILYASSTAVHWNYEIPYVRGRREEEQAIQASGIPYILFRPSAPYGPRIPNFQPKHQESFQTLVHAIQKWPVVPVIGHGRYHRQPIHTEDFAKFIGDCIAREDFNRTWDVAGASAHRFNDLIQILQQRLGRSQPLLHIPKRMAVLGSKLLPNLEPNLIRAIDSDERFSTSEIEERIALRTFPQGCMDLLR